MSKKDYEKAARIAQQRYADRSGVGTTLGIHEEVVSVFVELFEGDNPLFNAERFRTACQLGANVKARPRKVRA